jgi:tripartite-type tricarboxylate transporter receptor subunit TctC
MTLPRRRFLQLAGTTAALAAASPIAAADTYPSRPVTIIVPFAPGGLSDLTARLIENGLRTSLGQPVVIENVGGANGSIGTGRVARAAADGYTIVLGIWNTHVANGAMYALAYDVVRAFEPIALLTDAPLLLAARKTAPANDLKELIAWVKANPGKISNGTVGAGSPGDLLSVLLQKETGAQFSLVPYRGAGPAMQDLVAGQIDTMFVNPATALPHVRAGSIKAFAVTAKNRLAIATEIPSVDEVGLSALRFSLWAALFAPNGTPKGIIGKLNAAAVSALADPTVREKLTAQGFQIPTREQQTPEALAALQKAEIEKWWPIIKAAGIKGE